MLVGDAVARLAVAQAPKPTITTVFQVSAGVFNLTGPAVNFSFDHPQRPMATRRDYWDVDEWGRFIPGGGVRYTL